MLKTLGLLVTGMSLCACSTLVKATKPGPIQNDSNAAVLAIPVKGAAAIDITEVSVVDSDQRVYNIDLLDPSYVGPSGVPFYFIPLDPAKNFALVGFGNRSRTYEYPDIENAQIKVVPGTISYIPAVVLVRVNNNTIRTDLAADPVLQRNLQKELEELFPKYKIDYGFKK